MSGESGGFCSRAKPGPLYGNLLMAWDRRTLIRAPLSQTSHLTAGVPGPRLASTCISLIRRTICFLSSSLSA